MTHFDTTTNVEFENAKSAIERSQTEMLADAIHIDIDSLDKSLAVLLDRIAPALQPQPEVPVDPTPVQGRDGRPRSAIIRSLDNIGEHLREVRNRLERATDRVDL